MLCKLNVSCSMMRKGCDVFEGVGKTPSIDDVWLSGGELLTGMSSSSVCMRWRNSRKRLLPRSEPSFPSSSWKFEIFFSKVLLDKMSYQWIRRYDIKQNNNFSRIMIDIEFKSQWKFAKFIYKIGELIWCNFKFDRKVQDDVIFRIEIISDICTILTDPILFIHISIE